jgi:uncharacterized protein involved in exopolysaccharide biosynthesis
MKRYLKLVMYLYPAAWRVRYSEEFDALLDDMQSRPGDLWDIFRGAIHMQLSTPAVYLKLGIVTAILGALVAGGISFALPQRYVSTAIMRITPQVVSTDQPPEQSALIAEQRLRRLQVEILSRNSLARMIQEPSLDLYREERQRYPVEDIIQGMRSHDIRIVAAEPKGRFATAFEISFEYPDRQRAQAVVRALVTRFTEANVTVSRQLAGRDAITNLEVLDPASLPEKPIAPNRGMVIAIGVGAGFLLGLLIAFLRGKPLRWTIWMAASGIVGGGAALAIAFYREFDLGLFASLGAATGIFLAAFRMRDRAAWKPVPYVKSALAGGMLCAIVAGFFSFAIAERYVSTAALRIYQEGKYQLPALDRLSQLQQEIFSRSSLADLIQRPALDLYRRERQRRPLEDIIQEMRRDIRMMPAGGGSPSAFTLQFEYPDRFKAQYVLRELITKFVGRNLVMDGQSDGFVIEVLDPASLPETRSSPNRFTITGLGFAMGILLGLGIAFFRRRPPGQAGTILRVAATGGAAGAVIAGAISFAIPDRYISTAVIRVKPPLNSGERVQQLMMEVLSRENVSDEMRRHLLIRSLDVGRGGQTTAFSISFEANDPERAHSTVQTLVSKFVEPTKTYNPPGADPANLEVLDPASIPNAPSFPARGQMAGAGLLAGIFLGPMATRLRRRRQSHSAAA